MSSPTTKDSTDRKNDPPLDMLELRGLLQAIGLSDEDAEAALVGIDANGDGLIQLSEWVQGLTPAMQSAIEAHLDNMDPDVDNVSARAA